MKNLTPFYLTLMLWCGALPGHAATGSAQTGNVTVDTRDAPTVTTPTAASLTATGAILGGNVTSDGGAAITERGVVYSATATNNNPLIGGSGVVKATTTGTTGVFSLPVTGLTQGTGYSYKAYAINSQGTSYTSVETFSTLSTNANLSNLTLSSGSLNPIFASGTTAYTASVMNATSSITVTPTQEQANATIAVRVNGGVYADLISGSPGAELALNVGGNLIDVLVTAQDGVTQKTYTITVTREKGVQNIDFSAITDKLTTETVNLSANGGGSGNPVTFTVTSGPGVITNNVLTFTTSGSVTITASQTGNDNYLAAPDLPRTFAVTKAPASVVLGSLAQVFDTNPRAATATTDPIGLAVEFTYNGSNTPPTSANSYEVVGTINDLIYQGSATGTLVIGKAEQVITFAAIPDKLTTDTVTLSATGGGSGNSVMFAVTSGPGVITNNILTFTTSGSVTITASQAGNDNYLAAPDVPRTFTVSKTPASVALGSLAQTFDTTPKAATATTDPSGLTVEFTYDGSNTAPTNANSYEVVGTINDLIYQGSATGTLVIGKAEQVIDFAAITDKLTTNSVPLSATGGGSGNSVTFAVTSGPGVITNNVLTFTTSGSVTITASQAGNDNYLAAPDVPRTFTVSKTPAAVTLGSLAQVFDTTPRAATATTDPTGLTVEFTYDGSNTPPTNADSYAVVGTINDLIYQGSATGTLVIGKAEQVISFASIPDKLTTDSVPLSATGGGSGNSVTFAVTSGPGVISNNVLTFTTSGSVTITASQAGNDNYLAADNVVRTVNVHPLFFAAETGLSVEDAGLVTLSPIDRFSVVTGAASHGGVNALKFTALDGGTTYAERTVVGPVVVSFWWRVSSEEGFDFFSYSVNGVQRQAISGDGAWLYQSFTLPSGNHQIRWNYTKDVTDFSFDDAGYLDDLVILEAYEDLQVTVGGEVVTGNSVLEFGSVQQSAADVSRSITLKNNGTIPMNVTATLPPNSGFLFSNGTLTGPLIIGAGQQTTMDIKMLTAAAGQKTALLGLDAPYSRTAPPAITLNGFVQAGIPVIACSWSGGALVSGQGTAVDFGAAVSDITFSVANIGGGVMTIASVSISPAENFQVISQPASSVAVNGTTTFTVRALDANRGNHLATLTVASNALNAPNFSIPLASESLLAVAGTGIKAGSLVNSGTTAAWGLASTVLADGSTGLAIQTGATPHSGNSTLGATFEGPGILSWNWKVSSQQNFDWLLCEVNGVEVAGISTKTAAWQSQVVQIPSGSQVRWSYRKDAANVSGADAGHLSDIRFSKYTTAQSSFDSWSAAHGGIAPTQSIPAGGLLAIFAWLGGVDPITGPPAGSYQATVIGGVYQYRYRVDKGAAGLIRPQVSTNLVNWDSRRMRQILLSEDSTSAVIELSVPATEKVFSRLTTE